MSDKALRPLSPKTQCGPPNPHGAFYLIFLFAAFGSHNLLSALPTIQLQKILPLPPQPIMPVSPHWEQSGLETTPLPRQTGQGISCMTLSFQYAPWPDSPPTNPFGIRQQLGIRDCAAPLAAVRHPASRLVPPRRTGHLISSAGKGRDHEGPPRVAWAPISPHRRCFQRAIRTECYHRVHRNHRVPGHHLPVLLWR